MHPVRALMVAERASSYVKQLPPLPDAIQVIPIDQPAEGVPLAPTADVLCCWGAGEFIAAPVEAAASRLQWIQALSAGVESVLHLPRVQSGAVLLANARGTNAPPIAEHVLACVLALARSLPQAIRAQAQGRWERSLRGQREVGGATLGLLGLGAIAHEVAWRAHGLGLRVIGTRRRPAEPLPPHVDALTDLDGVLRNADFVVVCLPLTAETRGLLSTANLAKMKAGACLINVSRGAIVDDAALVAALQAGRLAGAALDVFTSEPLPESSPLWQAPGVLITPHVAGASPHTMGRTMALFADNLLRFSRGEALQNVIDPGLGY